LTDLVKLLGLLPGGHSFGFVTFYDLVCAVGLSKSRTIKPSDQLVSGQ